MIVVGAVGKRLRLEQPRERRGCGRHEPASRGASATDRSCVDAHLPEEPAFSNKRLRRRHIGPVRLDQLGRAALKRRPSTAAHTASERGNFRELVS